MPSQHDEAIGYQITESDLADKVTDSWPGIKQPQCHVVQFVTKRWSAVRPVVRNTLRKCRRSGFGPII